MISSVLMAWAWLAHLRFRKRPYGLALAASWFLVLPEYVLNVSAFRWGFGTFGGGEMAAINLAASVVCMALVARLYLSEKLEPRQVGGFALMVAGVVLIAL